MIRRLSDFVFILLFVWACMLLGLWFIESFIVPFELHGFTNAPVTGILKVTASSALVLLWLWAWREIVRRIFWRAIDEQQNSVNPNGSEGLEKKTMANRDMPPKKVA